MTPPPLFHRHTFDNGLVLLAEPMPSVRSAAYTLLLPAGAAYEEADRGGTAAMLADWIGRGSGDLDSRAVLERLDHLGANHGESAGTLHTGLSAATLGRTLLPTLAIHADMVLRPRLEDDELEPIRSLALQGLQSLEDDPGSKVVYELRKRHFPDPWGRNASGTTPGVEAATSDDLRAFQLRRYRPDGAILAVAGAIDWPALRDEVGRLFGEWEPRPGPEPVERITGPLRDQIHHEAEQIQVALAYPTAAVGTPEYYQARAASTILGGYASARLFTEVREKRGLCYSVYASYEGQRDRAAVLCLAGTSADRAQETLDVMLAEVARLADSGVEADELDMMRAGLKSSLVMQQESSMSRAGSLASDWYHLGRVRPIGEIAAALDALTPGSVSAFAKRTDLDAMTILTLGPRPLRLPPEA